MRGAQLDVYMFYSVKGEVPVAIEGNVCFFLTFYTKNLQLTDGMKRFAHSDFNGGKKKIFVILMGNFLCTDRATPFFALRPT